MPGDVMARVMEIVTPLGEDVLLFHGMSGREEMSRPFEYTLDLLSKKKDVSVDDILGKNVTIKLGLPDDQTRYFNGYVTRFAQGAMLGPYYRYLATVRPWLWFLTRTADCRIFQEMKVPDIIKAVFADHGAADYKFELTGSYKKWTYCVQYRETDFNFVSRLMEQEGIGYYFRHSDGHDTMVLTDSTTKHVATPGYEKLSFISPEQQVKPDTEHIHSWDFHCEIQPGVYVHDDYDLERPSVELKTNKTLARGYAPSDYEVYDYPGTYIQKPDGEQYAAVRIDELGSQFHFAHASTNARGIAVGALWSLEHHKRDDQNCEYLIVAANYDLSFENYESLPEAGGTGYRCSFAAMPSAQQFRPKRITPKPFVQGPQTAVVVGPGGEEIYTDKYGRVKVQFHWDRRGKKDENSSCWIRVSHPWAGKGWGAISNPRIGQEVIVDFLEGDPDQPIITGRVYNAEQMPPYDLPGNKTQSGIKSRSSKGGGGANFNEIRMEDLKGSEQVFIHAEKNQDIEVENDESHWVGHDRTKTIDHDETTQVKHDRTETVDNNETITVHANRTETVDQNETITIHMNRGETVDLNETINIGGNRSITVSQSEDATVALQRTHTVGINETISVGAAQEITIGAMQAITVGASQTTSVGANQSNSIGSKQSTSVGAARSISVGADQTTSVKGKASMSVGGDETRNVSGGRTTSIAKDDALTVSANRTADISKNDTHKAGKVITVEAGDKVVIQAANEIKLTCGQSSMVLKKNGNIEIKGMKIDIQGSQSVKQEAAQITSDASAVNTNKGGLVKIN
jgi:type VI secretion system secreted protein VgrG